MSVDAIAKDLTALCKVGQFQEAITKYYAPNITSVEGMGEDPVSEGLPAVMEKMKWWEENMQVHEMTIDGPFVNSNTNTFAVEFILDATMKASGQRNKMREIGVYKVKDDKIVHEQFIPFAG